MRQDCSLPKVRTHQIQSKAEAAFVWPRVCSAHCQSCAWISPRGLGPQDRALREEGTVLSLCPPSPQSCCNLSLSTALGRGALARLSLFLSCFCEWTQEEKSGKYQQPCTGVGESHHPCQYSGPFGPDNSPKVLNSAFLQYPIG